MYKVCILLYKFIVLIWNKCIFIILICDKVNIIFKEMKYFLMMLVSIVMKEKNYIFKLLRVN